MTPVPHQIALPALIDLDALDRVRDTLAEALDSGPVSVSAQAVERVSTNALFMLLSAALTARRNGFAFAIEDVSPGLETAIGRLGLAPAFAGLMKG